MPLKKKMLLSYLKTTSATTDAGDLNIVECDLMSIIKVIFLVFFAKSKYPRPKIYPQDDP